MRIQSVSIEKSLFCLAFLLAIGVRFTRLGAAPLSDFEADWALQAWQLARGSQDVLAPQPGYVLLTGLFFFIFNSGNALARLLPALAGSFLIWLPFTLRRWIGSRPALVAAFGLALDPGLAALSTLAGGPMLAVGTGLLALGLFVNRKWIWAGLCAGLALLSGPAVLHGALGLVLAWLAWRLLMRRQLAAIASHDSLLAGPTSTTDRPGWRAGLAVGGGTILLAGSLFFSAPQGLTALFDTLPVYLNGWVHASGIPASRSLAALVVYQPFALAFGLAAALKAWLHPPQGWMTQSDVDPQRSWLATRWLSLWALAALLLALSYPNRQTGDLAWVLVPLWGLAGIAFARHLQAETRETLPALGQAILIFLLLALAWVNLAGLAHVVGDPQVTRLRWAVIAGTLGLGAVTSILIALGWSMEVAQRGLAWGGGFVLGLSVVANLWGVTQLRPNSAAELWKPLPLSQEIDLIQKSLGDLSEWHTGQRNALEIDVIFPAPSLQWALRDWPEMRSETVLARGETPEVIITSGDQTELNRAIAYRGQDFAVRVAPDWKGALPPDWINWLVFRKAPQVQGQIIVWARTDIFPDGGLAPAPAEPASPQDESVPGSEE
jgi:hypothetical protein